MAAEEKTTEKAMRRPRIGGNCCSRLFFWPANSVIKRGFSQPLNVDDLWVLEGDNRTHKVAKYAKESWESARKEAKSVGKIPSLLAVLIRHAPILITFSVLLFFLNVLLGLLPSFILPAFIKWLQYYPQSTSTLSNANFNTSELLAAVFANISAITPDEWAILFPNGGNISSLASESVRNSIPSLSWMKFALEVLPPSDSRSTLQCYYDLLVSQGTVNVKGELSTYYLPFDEYWHGWMYAGIVSGATLLSGFTESHGILLISEASIRMRAALMYLIYEKALTLSKDNAPPTGNIMTLLTADTNIISMMVPSIFQYILTPVQLIAIMALLWYQIGPYSFISLGVLLLMMPFGGFVAKKMFVLFALRQDATDARVKLVNELVQAIRIVKALSFHPFSLYYAWEKPMKSNIMKARAKEIKILKKAMTWVGGLFLTLGSAPTIAMAPNLVTLAVIFTTVNLLNLMRFVFVMLPTLFQSVAQVMASVNRIRDFLILDDVQSMSISTSSSEKPPFIELKDASFKWKTQDEDFALKDISLKVDKKHALTIVVGSVGSGKSCLVQSMIGQVPLVSGNREVVGSIAYVPQSAWILNETVRDNILFGREYDEALYSKVVNAVALINDFKLMSAGDKTEIGERGVNLSGGQKQRIALARALYSNRDIFILDDPLSAVDAHVGKHIFDNAIKGFLKGKLVVFVTNNIQYIPESDQVVVLENGKVISKGKYSKLLKTDEAFKEMMRTGDVRKEKKGPQETRKNATDQKIKESDKGGEQYKEEGKEAGNVPAKIYWYWAKNGGIVIISFSAILMAIMVGLQVSSTWWLQYWPKDYYERVCTINERPQSFYIWVYSVLNSGVVVITAVVFFMMISATILAAQNLHKLCLDGTMRAPVSFFDTTPMGRIIARFATDVTILDGRMLQMVWQAAQALFSFIAIIVAIGLGQYWFYIAIPFFVAIYYVAQMYYRRSSIEIQRLEAVTRAPLFSFFSETLNGIASIRAYRTEKEFSEKNVKKLDYHNSVYFALSYANTWFGLVLSLLGGVLQTLSYFLVVIIHIYSSSDAGLLSVALSMAAQVTMSMKQFAQSITLLEVQMNAVERIKEYSDLPEEPAEIIEGHRPPEHWPEKGSVTFDKYSFRYRDGLPLVLKDIDLKIAGGEKVGIVGRTGSGKSTLVSALYCLAPPAAGKILIDGLDITSIGVEDLRSKLSIIPQEPQLFVGDIRYNLDPFDSYSDEELWKALELAGLKEFVNSLPKKLNETVLENGSNFSAGQRQLFCLARALLRKSRILILDEATASVDFNTDLFIQRAIRTSFPSTTLLVIAHRLNTVMDMDKMLVMDKGEVAEFDTPAALVDDEKTILYSMVEANGKSAARHLIKMAHGKLNFAEVLEKFRDGHEDTAQAASTKAEPKQGKTEKKKKKKRE